MKNNTDTVNSINHFSRYLSLTAVSVGFFVLLTAIFNGIVDAEGRYNLVQMDAVNKTKYFSPKQGGRLYKSIMLKHHEYDGVIFGTSRAEVGLDPQSSLFSGYKVFNAGLSGTNMYEIDKVIDYTLETQNLKFAVIGLDFLMFSSRRETGGDYPESYFSHNRLQQAISDIKYLFSTRTLVRSIKTVYFNMTSTPSDTRRDGFRDKSGQASKVNHRKLFTKVLTSNFLVNPATYGAFEYSYDRLKRLESSLEKLSRNNVDIYLFISPVHARQLESLIAVNLYEQYNNWKRDLVNIVEGVEHRNHYANTMVLWDFSGYNRFTTETVPGNSNSAMSWYWESSHYKKELGDILLSRMLAGTLAPTEENSLVNFGHQLNSSNINNLMSENTFMRKQYAIRHPEEISDVNLLANQTYTKRKRLLQ